jgi:hypothetical protein
MPEHSGCGWPDEHCDFCAAIEEATCPDCDALLLAGEDRHAPGCPRISPGVRVDVYRPLPDLDAWIERREALAGA